MVNTTSSSDRGERVDLPSAYESLAAGQRLTLQQAKDATADRRERYINANRYYYGALRDLITFLVESDKRVLSLPCDIGQYLEWVRPTRGVGIDNSVRLVEIAQQRNPQFTFQVGSPEETRLNQTFDYILVVNGVNKFFDIQATFAGLRRNCESQTRVVVVFYNFLWQSLVVLAEKLGLKMPEPPQNWLSSRDVAGMLRLEGFEVVRKYSTILMPVYIPMVSWLLNRVIARLPGFHRLCFVQALVARPVPLPDPEQSRAAPSVSIVIPCRNERDNIEAAVIRTPDMGSHTELIFCDDKSTDGTADEVRRMQACYPHRDIRLVDGPGIGKADNVWTGFDAARGDILMILDADLTVPPEELPRFYAALVADRGEFINGSRMVYPMQHESMRSLNVLGNKAFSLVFSHILRQGLKDTLCGTKALWRRDYERIRPLRGRWGIRDRWGDYELIFGAARTNLHIVDLPVHYLERLHGVTKMTGRFANGIVMLRMCVAAYRQFR